MLIGKMNANWKETHREAIRDHKKVLTEILSHLNNLEAGAKRIVEDQRSQKEKMECMEGTDLGSRMDKGPRSHTTQNNPLPQNSGGILVHKNVDRQDER